MNKLGKIAIFITIILVLVWIFAFPEEVFADQGDELDLESTLIRAEEFDSELKAARQQLEAAEQRRISSETILNPKIEGEMGWQRTEAGDSEGELAGAFNYSNILAESSTISSQLDMAELEYELARLDYRERRNEILENVAEKYYSLLETREQITSQEQRIAQMEALYRESEERYEDEMLTEAGLLEFKFELKSVRQHLQELEDRAQTERRLLARRLDIDPHQLELEAPENFSLAEEMNLEPEELEDGGELIQRALDYRSDFQSQLLAAELAEEEAEYIYSQKSPDLIFSGEYNFDDGRWQASVDSNYEVNLRGLLTTEDDGEVGDMFEMENNQGSSPLEDPFAEEDDWEITAAISYEFSDGGRREAEMAEAGAREEESKIRADDLAEMIEIEIESLLRDISRRRNDLEIAATNLERAELEYDSARTRRRKNAITESEFLEARSLMAEAEMEKIKAEYELGRKKIELLSAMQGIYPQIAAENRGLEQSEREN